MSRRWHIWTTLNLCALSWADLTTHDIYSWSQPRGAIIRSDVFLQGGMLQVVGNDSSSPGQPTVYNKSSLLKLSLNDSFDLSEQNNPPVFVDVDDSGVPPENVAYDGFMFADYDEFYTYGGIFPQAESVGAGIISDALYDAPRGRESSLDRPNTAYSPNNGNFQIKLAAGSGANAPSESRGFYFGGFKRADNKAISIADGPDELTASDSLVIVDTSEQANSVWTIPDLPSDIRTRARAMVNWIPVGEQGMLVVIGGVLAPVDILNFVMPWNDSTKEQGNNFTQEILLYDIQSSRWFRQDIKEGSQFPTRLTQACSVVATRFDDRYTHHDIYMYGGFDGNDSTSVTGKVEVLSIPSFQYIQLPPQATTSLPRLGHSCFSPYPNQMIAIGGTDFGGAPLNGTGVDTAVNVFDLNNLQWTGKYDPTQHADYTPNSAISSVIADDEWREGMDPQLVSLLNATYDQRKLRNFGPFAASTTSNPSSSPTPTPTPSPSGNKWVVPVAASVGTVGGLALLGLILFCAVIRPRRRKVAQARRSSNITSNTTQRNLFHRWLDGTTAVSPSGNKELGSETDDANSPAGPTMSETPMTPELEGYGGTMNHGSRWSSSTAVRSPLYGGIGPHEVDATESGIHEVHGRSSMGTHSPNIREYPLYPPSVVSGGRARSEMSEPVSQPTSAYPGAGTPHGAVSEGSASPASAPPHSPQRKPMPFATISETAVGGRDRGRSGMATKDGGVLAVSPLGSPQRPSHHRHNSSLSSGLSPLPSPGERPEVEDEEEEGVRGMMGDEKRGATI